MQLEINYNEELNPYLEQFDKYRIRGNKLQSSSPFRVDNKPSFAVNLDTGVWIDSGAVDQYYHKGNFISLLAFLMNCNYEDAELYLATKYNLYKKDTETLTLNIQLSIPEKIQEVVPELTCLPSNYLKKRGIPVRIQKQFNISRVYGAIAIPIYDWKGKLVNYKYRKIKSKTFWYECRGKVKQHIYAFNQVINHGFKYCYIVEGEIDALTFWTHGLPAVATFGASITDTQLRLLKRLDRVIIATDNDKVGRQFHDQLADELLPFIKVQSLRFNRKYKDVNEIPIANQYQIFTKSIFPVMARFVCIK